MKPKNIEDVKFYPLQRQNKKTGVTPIDNLPVIAKFGYDGKRLEYNTGVRVSTALNKDNESIWDIEKQRATRNSTHHGKSFSEVNNELTRVANAILKIYDRYRLAGEALPLKIFSEAVRVDLETKKPVKLRIGDAFAMFIESEGGSGRGWSVGLTSHFETIKSQLVEAVNGLPISEVDSSIFESYRKHLLSINTRNSTIENKLKRLKWFLRWCIEQKGFINGDVSKKILSYKIAVDKMKESDRIKMNLVFLEFDELKAIESVAIPPQKQYLERVRDCFLFSVHTSLRHGDLKNLKKTDVKGDTIEIFSQKGSELLTIDLSDKAKAILNKYKDIPGELALPVASNEKMNEFLKELGYLAKLHRVFNKTYFIGKERKTEKKELWNLLSTHVARRTFVTLGSELGIPADVIMSCTGHEDLKMLKIYKGMRDEHRKNEMKKLNQL
jgi:integrase